MGLTRDIILLDGIIQKRIAAFKKKKPRTSAPQGKVGVLYEKPAWQREFAEPRFKFRKFNAKTFDSVENFIKGLEKKGFVRLGSGAFSTVLAKPDSERVLKVIRRPDGWINYVHWAAQIGEAGHFAPKVFSYKKVKLRKGEIALASMERLEYTLEDTPPEHALKILPDLIYRAEKNAMAQKFTDTLAPGLLAFLGKMKVQWNAESWWKFDLHSGNLMVRKDGTFVVVDPVSRGEEGFTRLREGDFGLPTVRLFRISPYDRLLVESNYRYRGQWAC